MLLMAASAVAGPEATKVVQCVEFPFAGMPPQLWERELVWMKNIGVTCVAFPSLPDAPLLTVARKLELPVWIINPPPGPLADTLLEAHGGPVYWVGTAAIPQPIHRLSALSPASLAQARTIAESQTGTVLWTDVETTATPALHRGALAFNGEEQPTLTALRRQLQLLRQWQPLLGQLTVEQAVLLAAGKLPDSVSARQLTAAEPLSASAVSIVNRGALPFRGELRVLYPPLKQTIKLPEVLIPPGDALWLPVNIPLAKAQSCGKCAGLGTGLGNTESIVYATAELTQLEYENGILAMEFSAPAAAEIVLHLASEPAGPYLAAGKPRAFDWDAAEHRVRLPIPAGSGPTHRVRVGLALTAPDISAFFENRKILTIGQQNSIVTTYSSEDVAKRSRLLAPPWLKVQALTKAPNEIQYNITVPATALHGSHVDLALETDGTQMSHTRLQLLRPISLRVREAINRHMGAGLDLPLDPPLVPIDRTAGRDLSITVRNNAPEIRTFTIEATSSALEFAQPKTEIVVAASSERDMALRVFADHAAPGLQSATLTVTGSALSFTPIRFLVIPRGETVSFTEGNSTVLESQRARAVFTADRLLEFTWKDSERNMLPEGGVPLGSAKVTALKGADLLTEGGALPVNPGKQGDVQLTVTPFPNGKITYTLSR